MDKTLFMSVGVQGMDCWLRVNQLTLCLVKSGRDLRLPVHEFIQQGANRIELWPVQSSASGLHLFKAAFSARVQLELVKDRGPGQLVQAVPISGFKVDIQPGELRSLSAPVLDEQVDLPVQFPRWRFLDLQGEPNVQTDQVRIVRFIHQLSGLFAAGQVDALLPWFSHRNRELMLAYNLDVQDAFEQFRNHLKWLCTECELVADALDPELWQLKCSPRAPIYSLFSTDGTSVLQFLHAESRRRFQLPVHVAVLNDDVFVVR